MSGVTLLSCKGFCPVCAKGVRMCKQMLEFFTDYQAVMFARCRMYSLQVKCMQCSQSAWLLVGSLCTQGYLG